MGKKDHMKEVALKHTEAMDRAYSNEIKKSIDETHVYEPGLFRDVAADSEAVFLLEPSYTQDSVVKHCGDERMAVLNFASYRHAGGGFLDGSMAQEEAICHSSFLYNVLRAFPDYYEWNMANYNKGLYLNRALYSPGIFFFDNDGNHVITDVITCAAPNRSMLLKDGRFTEKENETALMDRIRFIRDICDTESVDVLIAGAFGCGVFAQRPETVARFFREYFSKTNVKKVIFAVPPDRNYPSFEEEFNKL